MGRGTMEDFEWVSACDTCGRVILQGAEIPGPDGRKFCDGLDKRIFNVYLWLYRRDQRRDGKDKGTHSGDASAFLRRVVSVRRETEQIMLRALA